MKKIIVLFLTVLLLVSLASCTEKNPYVLVSADSTVNEGVYAYYLDKVMSSPKEFSVDLKNKEAVENAALSLCKEYMAAGQVLSEEKISFSQQYKSQVAEETEREWSLFGNYYKSLGMTKPDLTAINTYEAQKDCLLQYYYGNDINIVRDAPTQDIEESYPGYPLRIGSAGNDVDIIQTQLNRIARNYPAIPRITPRNAIYDQETANAVRKFQEIFNLEPSGEVDKSTWYKIKRFYAAVKRLGELTSEGLSIDEAQTIYSGDLREGASGIPVQTIQYYLNVIAYFNPNLSLFSIDGFFGPETVNAVENFQREYGLSVTGIIDETTWNKIIEIYDNILKSLPEGYQGQNAKLYPGYFLTVGARGEDVRTLQTYLDVVAANISSIPRVNPDGIYGEQTRSAVAAFQHLYGIPETGYVGPVTWYAIARQYELLSQE